MDEWYIKTCRDMWGGSTQSVRRSWGEADGFG